MSDFTPEEIAEFNRFCAEYMYPDAIYEIQGGRPYLVVCDENGTQGYPMPDFYHDANDRNKVIEKMRITIFCFGDPVRWKSYINAMPGSFISESRDDSSIACITKVLENLKL